MTTYYCSYSDVTYFPKIKVLVNSIRQFDPYSEFHLLCLDQETFLLAQDLSEKGVITIRLGDVEAAHPELLNAKNNRTPMEYVFTLTPYLMKIVCSTTNLGSWINYLDADLCFFSDPQIIWEELNGYEVGIITHNYPNKLAKSLAKYGRFNVGLVAIRNSELGTKCLDWWASQCLDWCGDEPVDGKYADQGYLDQFPSLFEGVKILENRGFNLAPWNTSGRVISSDSEGNVILGDYTPLTFFHFHGIKRFGNWMVTSQLNYRSPASKSLMELVYEPYLRELWKAEKSLENKKLGRPARKLVRGKGLRKLARNLSSKLLMVASVITGNAVHMSRLK